MFAADEIDGVDGGGECGIAANLAILLLAAVCLKKT